MYANIPPHLYYMLKKVKVQGTCDSIIAPSCPHPKLSLTRFNKFGAPLRAQLLKILIRPALMAPSESLELGVHYIVLPPHTAVSLIRGCNAEKGEGSGSQPFSSS